MTATLTQPIPNPSPTAAPSPAARLLHGRDDDPVWARPSLLALLAATAVLYLWGLGDSGWANSFYAAAAQAGSENWKAFFFGSSDAANSITVDKTPAALWPMALAIKVFGLSSWSILVPQALMGVAAVGVTYAAVRRAFPAGAALIAAGALAATPAAALMFRFNNPDAMLVLLLACAAYATQRACERGSGRWLAFAGALVGFGFLAKMLQALLVVPALALAYLMVAPIALWPRVKHLLVAGVAMVAAAGWWVVLASIIPDSPYIGGSQDGTVWDLTFGYNGVGRLTGDEPGSVGGGGGPGGGGMWGETGWGRMFNLENGSYIAWLLPAALILTAAGLWAGRSEARTSPRRAAFVIWGGWLLTTVVVFSQMQGIYHAYYTVALAPAIGAAVGMGALALWEKRRDPVATAILASTLGLTAVWSAVLLHRTDEGFAWLRYPIVLVGLAAAVLLLFGSAFGKRGATVIATVGLVAALTAPAAMAIATASTPHDGSIPGVGTSSGMGPGGGGGPGGPGGAPGGGGGMGGLLGGSEPGAELTAALEADADAYTWIAATVGANNASGYQLATEEPVMPIGGFNGSDPSPILEEFQRYVAAGKIHWFIGGGGMGGPGGDTSAEITAWVQENYTATTVDGVTLYDLTGSGA